MLTKLIRSPGAVLFTLAVLAALILLAAQRTSWSQAAPLRLSRRRAWGELVSSARQMYRLRPRVFIGIGVLFIPLGLVISAVQYVLFQVAALAPLVDTTGQGNVSVAGLALGLGLLFTLVALELRPGGDGPGDVRHRRRPSARARCTRTGRRCADFLPCSGRS